VTGSHGVKGREALDQAISFGLTAMHPESLPIPVDNEARGAAPKDPENLIL
jgi:hypothetical protein